MGLNNTQMTKLIWNIRTAVAIFILLALQGVTGIVPVWGTTLQFEDQKMEVTDGFASYPVAMDGDVALVGVKMFRASDGPAKDAVYVFRKVDGQWVQEQKLEPWDENFEVRFQNVPYRPLAIDGNVAMVPGFAVDDGTTLVSATGGSRGPGGVYSYSISSDAACGCSSEVSDPPTIALPGNNGSRSIQMTWPLGLLLLPFLMSLGIQSVSRKRKKH